MLAWDREGTAYVAGSGRHAVFPSRTQVHGHRVVRSCVDFCHADRERDRVERILVSHIVMGAMEGGSEQPLAFRAKQHFYFVMTKDRPMQISFDGSSFAGENSSQSLIAVIPRKDGTGGQLGWMIYMGESGDPKAELKKLIEQVPNRAPAAGQQQASR